MLATETEKGGEKGKISGGKKAEEFTTHSQQVLRHASSRTSHREALAKNEKLFKGLQFHVVSQTKLVSEDYYGGTKISSSCNNCTFLNLKLTELMAGLAKSLARPPRAIVSSSPGYQNVFPSCQSGSLIGRETIFKCF